MMKSINISTKITLLILAISLVAVAAISFFSFDYHLKANQEKFATNLGVIADNRAAYFNTYFERAGTAIKILQNSDRVKGGGAASAAPAADDMSALMGGPPAPETESADSVLKTSVTTDQSMSD